MSDINQEWFLVRTSLSLYYKGAAGTSKATPKLYTKGSAIRIARDLNAEPVHPIDGKWEVVPVDLVLGQPLAYTI